MRRRVSPSCWNRHIYLPLSLRFFAIFRSVCILYSCKICLYHAPNSRFYFSTPSNQNHKMATAVLQPLQGLSLDGGIMPPSPISQNSSRHGRSRHGGSVVKGNKGRGRGYSIVDDREGMIFKALTWVLKRTINEDDEQQEGEEKLVADADGWVDCEEVVSFCFAAHIYHF